MIEVMNMVNWCLLAFGVIAFIGWAGSGIAYRLEKDLIGWPELEKDFYWYEVFSWVLYVAFSLLILAVFVRFALFLITGE